MRVVREMDDLVPFFESASSEAKAIFLPEASLLWLPTAGSQQEFSARMGSSIALS